MQGDIYHNRPMVDVQDANFVPYSSDAQGPYQQFISSPPEQEFHSSNRLIPAHIDMNRKKNMEEHSTIYYSIPGLVLRRGQEFSLNLLFNQAFHPDENHLSLIFKPQTWRNFPVVKIPLNSSSNGWSVKTISTDDEKKNHIALQILSPVDALIGKYSLLLEIRSANRDEVSVFQFDSNIYFLCNPWGKDDSCGFLSSNQIDEYVLNEHGQIFLGSSDIPRSIPWYFGQFESSVLLAALTLLNRVQLSPQQHIDSTIILRILASKICSDPGTLNGIFPSSSDVQPSSCQENGYSSSPAILKQYLSYNGQAMQGDAGSNWQHAAVFCSLCRSLGIPCRLVTVYNAIAGEPSMQQGNTNVTRPWYLWNECWTRREDLPRDHSGWQVMDSSSIQHDPRTRRLGPCSVTALKGGILDSKWDTPKIFSLLHGNQRSNNNVDKVINTRILTKSLKNDHDFEDLTHNYLSTERYNQISGNHDVQIEAQIPDSLKSNESLNITLNTNNRSYEPRTLTVVLSLVRINPIEQPGFVSDEFNQNLSSGGLQSPIQPFVRNFHLNPNQPMNIQLRITENQPVSKGSFDTLLKLNVRATVKETGQVYRTEKYFLNEEDITMKLFFDDDVIEIGQSTKLNIQINNSPLHVWHNGHITIDGFGILVYFPVRSELSSNNSVTIPVKIIPSRIGIGRLYVTFAADSLCLPPQSVLLEVTGLPEKNTRTIDHGQPQQQPAMQKEFHQDVSPPVLPSGQETRGKKLTTPRTFSNLVRDELWDVPQNTPECQTPINNTNPWIGRDRDQTEAPTTHFIPKTETVQITTTTEEVKKEPDATSAPDIPLQSKSQTTHEPTPIYEANKPETTTSFETVSTPSIVKITHEEKKEDEKPELPTHTTIETSTDKIPVDHQKEDADKPQEKISASTPATVTTINYEEKKPDEENKPLYSPLPESSTRTITAITTTENKKEDDRPELSKTPSFDKTVENKLPKAPSVDHTSETSDTTTTVEEKDKDEQKKLPKVPSVDRMTETVTETTMVQGKKDDEDKKLSREPSLDKPSDTKPIIESPKEDKEVPLSSSWSSYEAIPEVKKVTVIEQTKEDQNEPSETPWLKSTVETVTRPAADEENKEDDSRKLREVPSSDTTTDVVSKVSTVEDKEDEGKPKLSKVPSLEKTTETITETTTVEDSKLPRPPSPDNAKETVTEITTTKDKKEDDQSRLSKSPSPDDTKNASAETPIVEEKKEEEKTELPKIPSVSETSKTVTEIKPVEDKKENADRQLPKVPSLDDTTETVTVTTTINKKDKDDDTKLSRTLPVDNITEIVSEIATDGDKRESEGRTSPKTPSLDSPMKISTETIKVEDKKEKEENKRPRTPSFDDTKETVTDSITNKDAKDKDQSSLSRESSLDKPAETITTEEKKENETTKLPRISSSDDTTKIVTETTTVEETKEGDRSRLTKTPSLDDKNETIIETSPVQDKTPVAEKKLPKVPSLDNTIETATVTSKPEEKKEDQEVILPNPPSSNITIPTIKKTTIIEQKEKETEEEQPKTPLLGATVDKIAESAPLDEKKEDDKERKLPKVPSLDTTIETVTGTTAVEDKKENTDRQLPKVPSLDETTEKVTLTTAVEEKDKDDHTKLTRAPSVDNIAPILAEVATTNKTKDEGRTSPKTLSPDSTIESVTVTTTSEEKNKDDHTKLFKVPSLDSPTEAITRTTVIENKKEDHESDSSKTPSLNSVEETLAKPISTYHNTEYEKIEPLETPVAKVTTETITETRTDEDGKEDIDRKLEKTPSLESTKETPTQITTTEDRKENEEDEPVDRTWVGTTRRVVTETTTTEEKKEDEGKLPKTSANATTDAVHGTPTVHSPVPENIISDSSFATTPQKIDKPVGAAVPLVSVVETKREGIEDEHRLEDKSAVTEKDTILPSDLQTVRPTTNIDVIRSEEILSPSDTTKNKDIEIRSTNPTVETVLVPVKTESITTTVDHTLGDKTTKTEEPDSSVEGLRSWLKNLLNRIDDSSDEEQANGKSSVLTQRTADVPPTKTTVITETKTEQTNKNEEPDSPVEDLRAWLKNLLNRIDSSDEEQTDGKATVLTQRTADVLPMKTTVITETKTERTNRNEEQDSPVEDLRAWLKNLLNRIDSSDEEQTNGKSTVLIQRTADVLPMKTTVITETTTTSKDDGDSAPPEDSANTVQHLVQNNPLATEGTVNGENSHNLANIQKTSKIEPNDPVTLTVTEEHPDRKLVYGNNVLHAFPMNTVVASPSSVSNIRTKDGADEVINTSDVERITDRIYYNTKNDIDTIPKDVSRITSISNSGSASVSDGRNVQIFDQPVLQRTEITTTTTSTVDDAESSNDDIATDAHKELPASVIQSDVYQSSKDDRHADNQRLVSTITTSDDDIVDPISLKQAMPISKVSTSIERKTDTNT